MIKLKNVNKHFGDLHVINNASLEVKQGEVVVICGPSGSGKSTLIRTINQLESIQSGEIWVDGINVADPKTDLNKVRAEVGFVFQHFNLYPHLTVLENIILSPVQVKKQKREEAVPKALALLERVGLAHKKDALPGELSGGQQQRVAVARALIGRPEVIFADEPTGALDTTSAANLLQTLAHMCEQLGQTVVMVTHDQHAAATTNRIIRLRDGHITGDQPNHHNDSPLVVGGIYDIPDGFTVPLTGPAGSVELTARVQEGWRAAVSPAVAQRLNGDAPTNATMCVRSTGSTMTWETEREPIAAIRGQPLMVDGSAAATEQMSSIITRLPLNRLPGSGRHPGHRPVRADQHHGCLGAQADQGDRGSACRRQLHPQDDKNPRDSWRDGGDDRRHPSPTSRFSTPLPRLWPSVCLPHCVRQGGPPRHHRSRLSLRTDLATRTIGAASAPAISLLHTYTNLT